LGADPLLAKVDFKHVLDQGQFVGRAPQQVDEFLAEQIEPVRQRYRHLLEQKAEVAV
jgi:adenylosuccinate lyase